MQAIIIKKNVFAEGSEIVTMYTRELGKVRAVARSVKLPKSKLAFALQPFFHTEIDLLPSKKIASIIGVKPIQAFQNIYADPKLAAYAMYAVEVLLKSTADEQPNEQLFDLFLKFLEHLNVSQSAQHNCADVFVLQDLNLTGYGLSFGECAVCAKSLANEEKINFSNRKGGFLCESCATNISDAALISKNLYEFLAQSDSLSFDQIDRENIMPEELHRFTESFAKHILERNLNSSEYLAKL